MTLSYTLKIALSICKNAGGLAALLNTRWNSARYTRTAVVHPASQSSLSFIGNSHASTAHCAAAIRPKASM